ncbi:MAG: hypothetical protein OER90_11080 [Gemmatimonadota bacterium]|nr:hypothetical protein [Gemmatimonadota bacterium]
MRLDDRHESLADTWAGHSPAIDGPAASRLTIDNPSRRHREGCGPSLAPALERLCRLRGTVPQDHDRTAHGDLLHDRDRSLLCQQPERERDAPITIREAQHPFLVRPSRIGEIIHREEQKRGRFVEVVRIARIVAGPARR